MTHYNRGDVVLVPFPFSDQTTTKKRPAVIISSNTYNDTSRDIVIMAITGQARGNIGIGKCMIINSDVLKTSTSTYLEKG